MYLLDFFKRLMRKANIPVIIYLVLNVFIVCSLTMSMFADSLPLVVGFLLGIVLYGISLAIALSSFGERILRLQTGCRTITDQEVLGYIMPIFNEVYARARQVDPTIPEDVQLFMSDDKSPNAFATGRRTVCVTRGMLQKPQDQIKAALGHEFGHLSHKDTDLILLITISNFFITIIITLVKVFMLFFRIIISIVSQDWAVDLIGWLTAVSVDVMMWLWTQIGTLLVLKASRSKEYEADAFSAGLGYGDSLCNLLISIDGGGHAKGLFATLQSSHPHTDDRVARIRALPAGGNPVQNQAAPMQRTQTRVQNQTASMQPVQNQTVPAQNSGAPVQNYQRPVDRRVSYGNNNSYGYTGQEVQNYGPKTIPAPAAGLSENKETYYQNQTETTPAAAGTVTCIYCGKVLPETAKFCIGCGKPVERKPVMPEKLFCPNCGRELNPSSRFCIQCGTKIK